MSAINRPRDWFYLAIIIAIAVLLRSPLVPTGITIDDACTAYVVEAGDWPDLINRIKTIEMSPPLYFLLLKGTTTLFGLTTPVLALTSLVLSVLTIPLIYLLGRATASARVGLCAAFYAAISLLAIIYSHEARTYALAGLLTATTLLLYLPFFDGKASLPRRLGLGVVSALLAYTHYTAVAYLGMMTLTAFIYRKNEKSRSLLAIPPMVAGLATLLPWYPILKYHSAVGTPWADPTPIVHYLTVLASNTSSTIPLPVVSSYLLLTLVAPALFGLAIALKPSESLAKFRLLCRSPKLSTLALLFFYSASAFGFITPYIFGYVRYMYPIACTGWVLMAVITINVLDRWSAARFASAKIKSATALLLASLAIAASALEVAGMARQDRSGLRRLAHDISRSKFEHAAYITTPDFVGIILVYYLKHECNIDTAALPDILGFAYPEGGLLPPKHEGRAACWQDPQLLSKYSGLIDQLKAKGAAQVVLVRDTYTPTSRQIPTRELTDKLELLLHQKLHQVGETEDYNGHASSYRVTRFAF
ncbi:MAG: glycosyltransferase family 39 protein [Cyanobacteria bacterium REEB67]|nr:glycosyltransferase family 39 protein [Cyanobacteria bacterium REEB67]